MLITRLKNAELIYDDALGAYHLNLTYEEESDSKIITYTYEGVPITFFNEPVYMPENTEQRIKKYVWDKLKHPSSTIIDFGYGPVPIPTAYNKRIDGQVHKVHNVTVQELEEILGFPINIIENETQNILGVDNDSEQESDIPELSFMSSSKRPERITIISDEEYQERIERDITEDGEQSNDGGEKNEDQ